MYEKFSPFTCKLVHCEASEETGPAHVTEIVFQTEDEDFLQDRKEVDGSPVSETPLCLPRRLHVTPLSMNGFPDLAGATG